LEVKIVIFSPIIYLTLYPNIWVIAFDVFIIKPKLFYLIEHYTVHAFR